MSDQLKKPIRRSFPRLEGYCLSELLEQIGSGESVVVEGRRADQLALPFIYTFASGAIAGELFGLGGLWRVLIRFRMYRAARECFCSTRTVPEHWILFVLFDALGIFTGLI
jgi:hypothetical protein